MSTADVQCSGCQRHFASDSNLFVHLARVRSGPCYDLYRDILRRAMNSSPPPAPTSDSAEAVEPMDVDQPQDAEAGDLLQDLEDLNIEDSGLVINIEDFGEDEEDADEVGNEDEDGVEVADEDTMYF